MDFREKAPKSAWRDMYVDTAGSITRDILRGHKSAGVPGTVAGLVETLRKYGSMSLKDVIQPAVETAYKGFIVDRNLEDNLHDYETDLREFENTMKLYTKNGELYREGDTLRFPDLGATLERIRDSGGRDFYFGKTAELIIDEMKRGGGLITKDDLESYLPVEREPVRGTYRGYEILSAPPPSSGGICLVGILNILEGFDIRSMGFNSSSTVHMMAEAMKLIYADRAYYLGDPDYTDIPAGMLISDSYADERRKNIDSLNTRPSAEIRGEMLIPDKPHTTHYSVVDKYGNSVAVTYTVNDLFGSQVIVDGAGFFLNNEMDDFSGRPGVPNSYGLIGGAANAIESGKKPLSSMTPTIIARNGKPFLVLGGRGGSRIITGVLQVIMNVIDHGMNIQDAVNMPRFHHQWSPDEILAEKFCLSADVINNLALRGHKVRVIESSCGEIEAIQFDAISGWIYGGPDPREGGTAIGY
jgi:gamma-glutamyltranspeptidase/glutathione hydrolase